MSNEKQTKIDIPESVEGYKLTLFWGLTVIQIVLVFIATLFTGFGVFALFAKQFVSTAAMFAVAGLILLAIVEIRGRSFYSHILFIISYYRTKPRVFIYHHYSASGSAKEQGKQLIFQQDNNQKTFITIFISLGIGVVLLILIGVYIYHVLHK
ncbi:MAG: hypothetical protein A2817_01760 [Candidatus Yanofskybacteria bacterium RIFCSPHIGHO2_01_FULL_39_8b]|uniref:DUF3899 domain-containing protein n=1 Tax=Candidatus Yanofskybacteria bacterium RIFCSPHIGHO2_01_FULL_39_8b TaxID=1802659 RepID=A0A1F8EBD0_9BACT|nr:MAG: hypothetical protein A2817_01760 [Candidatus Yanofskybacteria bacterium RIFCSPHIGHO2_01_FULL_39_8b]